MESLLLQNRFFFWFWGNALWNASNVHHVLTIFELKATSGATDVSLTITKAIGFFPDESAATTNMAMENPPFSMGNTSSNGGFHCHVHFREGKSPKIPRWLAGREPSH